MEAIMGEQVVPDAVAFSADVESDRVVRVHFNAPVGQAERNYLLAGINAVRLQPRLLASIQDAIAAIEKGDLYERMCCDGRMCGCRGSDNAEFLVHCLREMLSEASRLSPTGDV
jgi:hypothetical protein